MPGTIRKLLAVATVLLLLAGCTRCGGSTPEERLEEARAAFEAGQYEQAVDSLGVEGLDAPPEHRALAIRALARTDAFDQARALVGESDGDLHPAVRSARNELCVTAAVEAIASDEPPPTAVDAASAALAPCIDGTGPVPEIVAVRYLIEILDGQPPVVPWEGGELGPPVPALTAQFVGRPPGPALDLAAAAFERALLLSAERSEEAEMELRYLGAAFAIGKDPALGDRLIARLFEAADEVADEDPQRAADYLERIYLRQIEGLEVTDEHRERAGERIRQVLFPIFRQNFRSRYLRKFGEEDAAAGIWDLDAMQARFPPEPLEARRERMRAWVYRIGERPRPNPSPDFVALADGCDDPDEPCVVPYERFARWVYEIEELERAHAAEVGATLQFP